MLVDLLSGRRRAEDVSATSLALCPLLHGQLIGKHLGGSLAHLVNEASAATQFDSRWQALWCCGLYQPGAGSGETVSYFLRPLPPQGTFKIHPMETPTKAKESPTTHNPLRQGTAPAAHGTMWVIEPLKQVRQLHPSRCLQSKCMQAWFLGSGCAHKSNNEAEHREERGRHHYWLSIHSSTSTLGPALVCVCVCLIERVCVCSMYPYLPLHPAHLASMPILHP